MWLVNPNFSAILYPMEPTPNMSLRQAVAEKLALALQKMNVEFAPDVMRPDSPDHGDWSSNCAMALAKQMKKAPRMVAEEILSNLDQSIFSKVEVVGPGFMNFFLKPEFVMEFVKAACENGFGRSNLGNGAKIMVEFVSANPTGPVTVANGRGAPLGDSIARLLEWVGYSVHREFYVNDRGSKITNLGRSLEQRYRQARGLDWSMPEEGYPGEYLLDIAKEMVPDFGSAPFEMKDDERIVFFSRQAVERMISWQKRVFEKFGIKFDLWFSEREMAEKGAIEQTLERLKKAGCIYESEGALWLRSTDYGDDKDFVVVKSTGDATYTLGDIAYHIGKFDRGFDLAIDLMGADHHGHVGPMHAGLQALGIDHERLEFVLYQLVHLFRGDQQIKMSKSSGEFVTLEELLDEVGVDAARYFYLMRSSDTHLNFDLELAKSQTMDNPVYYVQYAHVRCCAIMDDERAKAINISKASPLDHPLEKALAMELMTFPDEVRASASARTPHRIASYAEKVAQALHSFYYECHVLNQEPDVQARRMLLVMASRNVLKGCLDILGVSAPNRM